MCSCCTGMKAKNVLARTWPEPRYQHLGHLVWEAEKTSIPPPSARVVNIKLFIQTGTAETEETEEEKLSNRLVVRSHIWNMQTKFLMRAKKTKRHTSSPAKAECPFHCACRDDALSRWPEIHPGAEKPLPDEHVVQPHALLCSVLVVPSSVPFPKGLSRAKPLRKEPAAQWCSVGKSGRISHRI